MAKYINANNGRFSGRLGTDTYQRNGIVKDFVSPVNTSSLYKQFALDCISFYSSQWKLLSQNNMMLWHQYALERSDVFCEEYKFRGMQSFISINSKLAYSNNNNSIVHLQAPIFPNQNNLLIQNFALTVAPGSYNIFCNPAANLNRVEFYSSLSLSPGIFKPRRCDFRLCGIISLAAGSYDAINEFNVRYLTVPIPGTKVFCKLVPINDVTGEVGSTIVISAIVA